MSEGWEPITTIRDGLYDRIPLNAPESALMATEAFLRLDRIQQFGFVSRVWPGAKHTRFEHSLGVMHLMRQGIAQLRRHGGAGDAQRRGRAHGDARRRCCTTSATIPSRTPSRNLARRSSSTSRSGGASSSARRSPACWTRIWGLDPQRVADLIDPPRAAAHAAGRADRGLLSGALDVDKLDYLPRDARACNVPYGGVDTPRLLDALRVREVNGAARIVVDDKGISPLHSLINARQEMFDNVYWHHTNRACMAMLLRAVQEAMEAGVIAPEELTTHDDASLLAFLSQPRDAGRDAAARRRAPLPPHPQAGGGGLARGRAISSSGSARSITARATAAPPKSRSAEMAAHISGLEVHDSDVLIDIPKPEKWSADVWVEFDRPPIGFAPLMPWHEVVGAQTTTSAATRSTGG